MKGGREMYVCLYMAERRFVGKALYTQNTIESEGSQF